jgi:integrase
LSEKNHGAAAPSDDLAAALAALATAAAKDPAALADVVKALASGARASDAPGLALPDNGIAIDDDALGVSHGRFTYRQKDKDMPRYFGPYPHRGRWRIMVRHEGRQKIHASFSSEPEAARELERLRAEAALDAGLTVGKAITTYEGQLAANGLKPRSIATTGYRLRRLLGAVLTMPLARLTPSQAQGLYLRLTGSVDSRLNTLAEAKTFFTRAKVNGWTDTLLLAEVHGEGRRNCGKTKLSLDESRIFLAACLQLATSPDPRKQTAGVGAAMALIFGMRASEITGLQVRDLDAGGTIIRIHKAKTRAGIRALQVPEWFRPYLQGLAADKQPTDLLVGRERTWLHRSVRAICRKAGVTQAPPHGLRGTHADLALVAAATPQAVSRALGHESLATTYRHYADQAIAEQHEHQRAVNLLAPIARQPN